MAFPRSGTVDEQTFSGTKDFVFARVAVSQAANLGVGDHLKFDTVDFSRPPLAASSPSGAAGGTAVSLDTTTAYVNTIGAAAVGRFTVRGGKLYKLECSPGYALFSGATGVVTLNWFDVTVLGAPVAIGQPMNLYTLTDAGHENSNGDLWSMFNPGGGQNDLFLIEVQITAVTALTSIGAAGKGFPTVMVETY